MRAPRISARVAELRVYLLSLRVLFARMSPERRSNRRRLFVVMILILPLALGIGELRAEDESIEAQIAEHLQANPTFGLLIFKLTLFDVEAKKEDYCFNRFAHFTSPDGKTARAQVFSGFRFRQPPRYKEAILLIAPGSWVLDAISCEATRTRLNGKFASITIKPREVISGGHLIVNYASQGFLSFKFSSRQVVTNFDGATIASLKRRLPVTFPKAKQRNLTPINGRAGG
ncbi:MAG: hypothetical protein AB7I42_03805 [Bradyrhizobium sp.]|uniref:hypothetical protein n=1 Tax=Bradyrhizobium sp. TaxID=376 RepID=UPI00353BF508